MFLSLLRALKFALKDFGRNIWLSFITVTILTLALLSFNVLTALNFFSGAAIKAVQDKIDVSVYFKPEADDDKINEMKTTLESLEGVKLVQYISREEGLESFRKKNQGNDKVLTSLDELKENPLGASLII